MYFYACKEAWCCRDWIALLKINMQKIATLACFLCPTFFANKKALKLVSTTPLRERSKAIGILKVINHHLSSWISMKTLPRFSNKKWQKNWIWQLIALLIIKGVKKRVKNDKNCNGFDDKISCTVSQKWQVQLSCSLLDTNLLETMWSHLKANPAWCSF